jgi:hypothetical protein
MSAGTVAAIWRYPIKSLRGERLAAATIGKVASIKGPRLSDALLACLSPSSTTRRATSSPRRPWPVCGRAPEGGFDDRRLRRIDVDR